MTPYLLTAVALGLVATPCLYRQDTVQQVMTRGAEALGPDQSKIDHHFYLYEDGGAIEVTVKDRKDTASRAAIRSHLSQIAQKIAAGDFVMPEFIRAPDAPGTDGLRRLRDRIAYAYDDMRDGGRIRISTRHARALLAVHEFLRFQIRDYKTGDPEHVTAEKKPQN